MITDRALMFFEKKTMAASATAAVETLDLGNEEYHGLASMKQHVFVRGDAFPAGAKLKIELLNKAGTVVGTLLPETTVASGGKTAVEMEALVAPIDGRIKFQSVRCTLTPDTTTGFPNGVSIGLTEHLPKGLGILK